MTASVIPAAASATITFYNGASTLGTAQLAGGTAMIETQYLAVGKNSLTASYSGDNFDAPSTSPAINQQVSKAPTTTILSSSPNPSTFEQPVTFKSDRFSRDRNW